MASEPADDRTVHAYNEYGSRVVLTEELAIDLEVGRAMRGIAERLVSDGSDWHAYFGWALRDEENSGYFTGVGGSVNFDQDYMREILRCYADIVGKPLEPTLWRKSSDQSWRVLESRDSN